MKIVDNRRNGSKELHVSLRDIPVGTTFEGQLGGHDGLFLRTHRGAVYLEDPGYSWDGDPTVRGYQVVDAHVVIED